MKTPMEACTIEQDDALKVIERYDTPDTFHFIDPPYVGRNMGHYAGMFNEENLYDLLELLTGIQGKFMLTMYPDSLISNMRKCPAGRYMRRKGWSPLQTRTTPKGAGKASGWYATTHRRKATLLHPNHYVKVVKSR